MIYLDHAANTPIIREALETMLPWFNPDSVGNPGSIHTQGVTARNAIDRARKQVAEMINADPSEIFFTSGGTESNNAWLKCFDGNLVLTTRLEHHSILEPLKKIEKTNGTYIRYVKVYPDGSVDLDSLEYNLKNARNTKCAVSVMWVNNELGTVNPMKEIGTLCKKYRAFLHTDAVQAAGHVPIDVKECSVDTLSLSGHKFGGPLGVGALYINNAVHKHPLIIGGGQEHEMRGGTENVPGIIGMGRAAEYVSHYLDAGSFQKWWSYLRHEFFSELGDSLYGEFKINGDLSNDNSNIISLTIPGVNSESLLLLLDQQEIYISAGSACSAASSELSHVLRGIGMSDEDAACTVRISMGFNTSYSDMIRAARAIAETAHRLKSMYQ